MSSFTGKLVGITYTDPTKWEKAARAMGYRRAKGNGGREWKVGTEVAFRIKGVAVRGQVWSSAPIRGWVWAAMENGEYVAVNCRYAEAYDRPGGARLGKAA